MNLDALSPLDGRYAAQTAEVAAQFSEAALMRRLPGHEQEDSR